jgi:chromosome segregation ATPase
MASDNDKNTDGLSEFYAAAAEVGAAIAKPVDCNNCPTVAEVQGRFERSEDQLTACREQVALFESERSQAEANAARLFQELVDARTERDEMRLELQRAKETVASCGEARESIGRMSKEVVRVCK